MKNNNEYKLYAMYDRDGEIVFVGFMSELVAYLGGKVKRESILQWISRAKQKGLNCKYACIGKADEEDM